MVGLETTPLCGSHVRIVRSSSTFWDHPVNILVRVLDVAGFAVDTILGVDLEVGLSCNLQVLINPGRAEPDFGSIIFC